MYAHSSTGPSNLVIWSNYVLFQELADIRKYGVKNFRNILVDESNILNWQGLIVPVSIELVQTELVDL